MENRPPAFQFYPADYLSDMNVILMDNQQGGCYLKLMSHEWLAFGKGIPREVNDLAKLCGESEEKMAMLWEGIKKCFNPHPKDDTKLIHPRLEKERKKINDNRKKRAKAGKQGANARWQTHSNRIAKPMAKNGSSSSITTSITTVVNKPKNLDFIKTAEEIITYLNTKANRNYRFTDKSVSLITSRLKEKYTKEQCFQVIDTKVGKWLGDPNMDHNLRIKTLFAVGHFDDYLNEKKEFKKDSKASSKLEIIKNWGERNGQANLPTRDSGLIDVGAKN